jgi:hypothetical protein
MNLQRGHYFEEFRIDRQGFDNNGLFSPSLIRLARAH